MSRSIVVSAIVLVALVVVMAAPVSAITGNWAKDNEHPFVGLGCCLRERRIIQGGATT